MVVKFKSYLQSSKFEKETSEQLSLQLEHYNKALDFCNNKNSIQEYRNLTNNMNELFQFLKNLPNLEKLYSRREVKTKFLFSKEYLYFFEIPEDEENIFLKNAKKFNDMVKISNKNIDNFKIKLSEMEIHYSHREEPYEYFNNIDDSKGGLGEKNNSMELFLSHCGLNNMFNWQIVDKMHDDSPKVKELAILICNIFGKNKKLGFRCDEYGTQVSRFYDDEIQFKKNIEIKTDELKKNIRKIELILRRRKKQNEKQENYGYVYVLSNQAYPNIYKIGSTYSLPEERAEELTGTGNLYPFKVEKTMMIKDAEYYEKKIHSLLDDKRISKNREFFEIDLDEIEKFFNKVSVDINNNEARLKLDDLKRYLND